MRRYPAVLPEDRGPRRNRMIRVPEVLAIDEEGQSVGVIPTAVALERAEALGLDLVEVAPKARPPVCRIMDYGRYRYEQAKKASQSKANRTSTKTLQMRPTTDEHDLQTVVKKATTFLERGDRVRLVVRMRGRERAFPQRWVERIADIVSRLPEGSKVVSPPTVQGRAVTAEIEPG